MVKSWEMSKWDKVSADMMSEEEEDDNGTFIRHRYAWRSDNFNRFIDKLEERIAKNSKKSLAKIEHMVTHLIHHLHSMLMSG